MSYSQRYCRRYVDVLFGLGSAAWVLGSWSAARVRGLFLGSEVLSEVRLLVTWVSCLLPLGLEGVSGNGR